MAASDHMPYPPKHVLEAFGADGSPQPLPGGTGTSVQVGRLVFKPHDPEYFAEAEWVGMAAERIRPEGFRIAEPVRAADGALLVDGWSATRLLDGDLRTAGRDDWPALFEAARAYNKALKAFDRPAHIDALDHRWALGDRVAFGEADYLDPAPGTALMLGALLPKRTPCTEPCQVVHGDLSGNVLFATGYEPAVIDVAPYWRPVAFSLATIAVDALLWYGAPVGVLSMAAQGCGPDFADHLVRALIFRLVALSEIAKQLGSEAAGLDNELEQYHRVFALIMRYQAAHRAVSVAEVRPYGAVLCDIDNVLRYWPSMADTEEKHGLAPGTFAATAFAEHRLLPAITGEVRDEQWRELVAADLVESGRCQMLDAARAFVADWTALEPRVDAEAVRMLTRVRDIIPVVLVSNATTRLEADLEHQGLDGCADHVVNTARIGIAKPDLRVFAYAAELVDVHPSRCLFLDDTLEHVESARTLGMTAVHVAAPADFTAALRPLLDVTPGS